MEQLSDSPRRRIIETLRQERRWALLESLILSFGYAAAGLLLTLILWWMLRILIFVSTAESLQASLWSRSAANFWTLLALASLSILGRRTLLAREINARNAVFFSEGGWLESTHLRDLIVEVPLAGPRCLVLASRSAKFFWQVATSDLERLAGPIQVALSREGRIVE